MAQASIQIFDEDFGLSTSPGRVASGRLKLVASTLTAAEVIASRVKSEWSAARDGDPPQTRARFVARLALNSNVSAFPSVEAAIAAAHRGFKEGRYLFFWNGAQVDSLEQRLDVLGDNEALFLRMLPLQGG